MEEGHPWTSQQLKAKEKDTKERANTKEKDKERATENTKEKDKERATEDTKEKDKERATEDTKEKEKELKGSKHKTGATDVDNKDIARSTKSNNRTTRHNLPMV